jgi:long-chain acyl-CoA synthetase
MNYAVTRTFDLLNQYQEKFPDKPDALAGIENKKWVTFSSKEYIENSNLLSYGLLALGIKKGDVVATITNNRPEWNFVDMGIAQVGAIHLPIFTTLDSEGYKHILTQSRPKVIFLSNASLAVKIEFLKNDLPETSLFTFDKEENFDHWLKIIESGKQNEAILKDQVESIKKEILPKDWVTLLYTSGTTDNSKGVMLSHENLMTNAAAAAEVFNLKPEHKYLSFLPLCHVGERMANYQTQLTGCSLYYAENIGTIARDLKDLKPNGFGAVPRILEKVYDRIMEKAEKLTGLKRWLFFWAMRLGYKYDPSVTKGFGYNCQLWLANKLVFSKWREALGGNVQFIGVGGAMLQEKIERVFWAAGIKLLNMYGLTETSPIITINRAKGPLLKVGTVGAPIKNVEVKIVDDGEIVCRGPNVMLGYYNNETATKEVIDSDGWFHTGDIGIFEDGKFLRITDRKKEIFKLSNGKYVQPQTIENKLKESPFIDQCMALGVGEKFASALISPNKEALKSWAKTNNINESNVQTLVRLKPVIEFYKTIVDEANNSFDKDEKLSRTKLIGDEWTPDTGELSPTLKLKRRVITEKYRNLINEIFLKDERFRFKL